MNLLTIKNLTKAYTDKVLFDGIDFSLEEGEKVGIIGINGTGKSTLLRIIAGIEEGDTGEYTKGNHVVINYLPQNPEFAPGQTILEYVIGQNQMHGRRYQPFRRLWRGGRSQEYFKPSGLYGPESADRSFIRGTKEKGCPGSRPFIQK